MERIFSADAEELGTRSGCPKGIFGIPYGHIDVAEIGAELHALVQLTRAVARLAEQEIMGPFLALKKGSVLAAGDLEGIDQDNSLLVHGHNSLITGTPR